MGQQTASRVLESSRCDLQYEAHRHLFELDVHPHQLCPAGQWFDSVALEVSGTVRVGGCIRTHGSMFHAKRIVTFGVSVANITTKWMSKHCRLLLHCGVAVRPGTTQRSVTSAQDLDQTVRVGVLIANDSDSRRGQRHRW
jgi:hypothetical protein